MSQKLITRLTSYWKLEAGNAAILPLAGLLVLNQFSDRPSLWVAVAMAACSGLLVIGAAAWRVELARIEGDAALAGRLMRWLGPSELPAQAIALLGAVAAGLEYWSDRAFTPSAIAASIFGALAVLEYINYYRVQLQHFDHLADFKRLVSGRGFRRPHLAKAIERWREGANSAQ